MNDNLWTLSETEVAQYRLTAHRAAERERDYPPRFRGGRPHTGLS